MTKARMDWANFSYDKFQRYTAERQAEQTETARKATAELLNVDSQKEYARRRRDQRFLVVEPDVPLDEATPSDYIRRRVRQKNEGLESHPVAGEMATGEYIKQREKRLRSDY